MSGAAGRFATFGPAGVVRSVQMGGGVGKARDLTSTSSADFARDRGDREDRG